MSSFNGSTSSPKMASPPSHQEIMMKLGSPTTSTFHSNTITSSHSDSEDLGGAILERKASSSRQEFKFKPKLTLTNLSSEDEEEINLTPVSPTMNLPLSAISEAEGSDSDISSNGGGEGNSRSRSNSVASPRVVERLRLSREHTRISVSDNIAVKSGYLMKKGERRKAWKKRWFVLRGAQVAMYKNDKEYRLLRLIPLSDIHTCAPIELKKHTFTFGIVTPDRTTYVKASSDREVQEWCSAVERAKEEVKASLTITSVENPTPEEVTPLGPLTPTAAIPIPISMPPTGTNLGTVVESYNTGISPSPPTPFSYTANSMMSSSFTSTSTAPHDPLASGSRVPPNSFALGPASALGSRNLESLNTLELGGVDAGLSRIVERQSREQQLSAGSGAGSGGESSGGEYGRVGSGGGGGGGILRRDGSLQPLPLSGNSDYFLSRSISTNSTLPPASPGGLISSSEDEDGIDANESWMPISTNPTNNTTTTTAVAGNSNNLGLDRIQMIGGNLTVADPTTVNDPTKVIMSGYLMKQGKRRNWRKRWFVLMSGSLSYQRSHMDGKIHQQIPLSEILDAIEYTPALPLPPRRPTSSAGPLSPSISSSIMSPSQTDDGKKNYEHCFKIITPKRTFLVTAPSEEEEIKWLAALQCLVRRR